jgi:hypothetical protein
VHLKLDQTDHRIVVKARLFEKIVSRVLLCLVEHELLYWSLCVSAVYLEWRVVARIHSVSRRRCELVIELWTLFRQQVKHNLLIAEVLRHRSCSCRPELDLSGDKMRGTNRKPTIMRIFNSSLYIFTLRSRLSMSSLLHTLFKACRKLRNLPGLP